MVGGEVKKKKCTKVASCSELAMASCKEGRYLASLAERLLKNRRSVFMSTLWVHKESGNTTVIKCLQCSAVGKGEQVHGQERPPCMAVRLGAKKPPPQFPVRWV